MKYIMKHLSLALLLSVGSALKGGCCPTTPTTSMCAPIRTTWVNMTVGQNLYTQYHKLLFPEGFDEFGGDCNECSWAVDLSATYRFIQSRNGCQIANALWGNSSLVFQGDATEDRVPNALIAEYFGMGPDTDLIATMSPRLRNQVLDFQLEISGEKMWAQINLPLTWAKWSPTKGCGAPCVTGTLGKEYLDGAQVNLVYTPAGDPATLGAVTINNLPTGGLVSATGTATTVWFDATSQSGVGANNSFIGQIDDQGLNVDLNGSDVESMEVTPIGGNAPVSTYIGYAPIGIYGSYSTSASETNVGNTSLDVTVSDVMPASTVMSALSGYTFGKVESRNYNQFNFNPCSKFGLADIPIMLGYDFCKSDAYHIGLYLKFVIPTGTKIDQCLLQYVLTPVIGNGRHFELGIGASAHANVWVCDTSSFGVYADGYIDYMFGACQTRTFDLMNQPMSRYALAYPLTGSREEGFTQGNTMQAIGDINLYQGNVTATRGEFMFDFIWACRNWELGLGYAFAGQSAEKMNCNSCSTDNGTTGAALVGNTYQNFFGVGPVTAGAGTPTWENGQLTPTGTLAAPAINFFDLGSTNEAAQVDAGSNAAYNYGTTTDINSAAFMVGDLQGNCSGLMSKQILNKIFGHIDYVWRDCAWQPEVGILGSIGFVPAQSVTANYWDLGARVGFAF